MKQERPTKESNPRGDLASGARVPLLIPPCVIREWNLNGFTGPDRAAAEAEHGTDLGYEFEWGQIIEETSSDIGDVPDIPLIWDFVLCGLHDEFLDAGGNLGELSDLALNFLNDLVSVPEFIAFEDDSDISAFDVIVHGEANAAAARVWLDEQFVPAILPGLMEHLRRVNRRAQQEMAAEQKLH